MCRHERVLSNYLKLINFNVINRTLFRIINHQINAIADQLADDSF